MARTRNRPRKHLGLQAEAHAVGLLALFLIAAPEAVRADEAPVPLDEIVAVVNGRPLFHSDLELDCRLSKEGIAGLERALDPGVLGASLKELIDDEVVLEEAQRLQVFGISPGEVDQAFADLRNSVGPKAFDRFLSMHQFSEAAVRDRLEKRLRVNSYLEGRFRLTAQPRDSDLQTYMQDHPNEVAELGIVAVREHLTRIRFGKLREAFIAEVRKRADIRILHAPDAPDRAVQSGSAQANPDVVNKGL